MQRAHSHYSVQFETSNQSSLIIYFVLNTMIKAFDLLLLVTVFMALTLLRCALALEKCSAEENEPCDALHFVRPL